MLRYGECMRGWRRFTGNTISAVYGVVKKAIPPPTGFRILMYHAVGSTVPGDVRGLYNMAPDRFKQHMKVLSEFSSGRVAHLIEMPEQGVAVTFDDGYRDNLECAAPILANLTIPFTVFVTPSFVLSGHPIYLSVAGLRELASVPGASIGAHGQSHRRLTECNTHQLHEELTNSRKWLEDVLDRSVTTMSYPHGAVNQPVQRAVAAAGYQIAAGSRFGANLSDCDPLLLARTDVWPQDTTRAFRAKLVGDWDWLRFRSP
jgi:peptidoglycan/xylan/chitin deacetylase (PgdA/CDA1 family)